MSGIPEGAGTFGYYADGDTAQLRRVELTATQDRVVIGLPDGGKITWPLEHIRRVPDQADKDTLVLSLDGDPVARLMIRDGEFIKTITAGCKNLTRRPRVANPGRIAALAGAAVASVALIIFVLVPLMADQLAAYLPPEGEQALGDATFEQIRAALNSSGYDPVPICDATDGAAALLEMQTRLNPGADLPYPIRVHVLDHDMVNAFALPGGRIVIFRGLIEAAESAEEVGAVFAHEIGHVVGRDPTRDALRSAGSIGVLGLLFGDFAGGTVVLFLANQLINASYSQEAEAAADIFAHELMTNAGLSPAALGTMFQRLRDKHGDAEGIIAHFASHPQLAARIEASLAAAEGFEQAEPLLSPDEWRALQGICGGTVQPALTGPPVPIAPVKDQDAGVESPPGPDDNGNDGNKQK